MKKEINNLEPKKLVEQYGRVRCDKISEIIDNIKEQFDINEQAEIINWLMTNERLKEHIEYDFKNLVEYKAIFNWFAKIRHYRFTG